MEEIIVSGCGDCPFFQHDSDEGSMCNHPSNDNVKFDTSGYNKTPDTCPLRTTSVTVIPSDNLKKYGQSTQ
jgi:hypothetical protein